MRFIKFVFGLLFLACFSCSSELYQYRSVSPEKYHTHYKDIQLYVDKDMNMNGRKQLEAAVNEFNYVLNGSMRFDVATWTLDPNSDAGKAIEENVQTTHQGIVVLWLNHDDPALASSDIGEGTLAFVNGIGNANLLVVIADRIGSRNLRVILLHELGHAIGAMHVNGPSLMNPYYGPDQLPCVDATTATQIAGYQHIPLDTINYCSSPNFK